LVPTSALIAQDSVALTAATTSLALDDADALAGNAKGEEKLFHLYNHLKEVKGSLVLTMAHGAGLAGFVLPDLRSRLLTLPAAALLAPDDALLEALIVKQFRDRQVDIDAALVAYLAPRMPRDAAGIRDLVERLDVVALAEGRKITIALARKILEDTND
jgi:chromosomal replication initiation ATPase DnaA